MIFPIYYFINLKTTINRPIVYSEDVQGYCLNLPFPDARVMERTQRYKYYNEKRRPFQAQAYLRAPNLFLAVLMCIGTVFLALLSQFKFGLRLLEKVYNPIKIFDDMVRL